MISPGLKILTILYRLCIRTVLYGALPRILGIWWEKSLLFQTGELLSSQTLPRLSCDLEHLPSLPSSVLLFKS